ncbi:MAG: hypothetical protein ABSD98_05360 [Candidatus Korobacteraceae bacterium]|jgi:hypothetical protein
MLARLLQILLPNGGLTLHMVETYFDESIRSRLLCVCGYIMEKDAAISLDSEWQKALKTYNLPVFRMSPCANGAPPFDRLSIDERIALEAYLINLIRAHVSFGVAVTVETDVFAEVMPACPEVGSPYAFCAHNCLVAVKSWADQSDYHGTVAHFFESGYANAAEANALMNRIVSLPKLRKTHRYGSHTFAQKKDVRPLQAADILVWQSGKDRERKAQGKTPRKDFVALTALRNGKPFHKVTHWDRHLLKEMADIPLSGYYPLTHVKF